MSEAISNRIRDLLIVGAGGSGREVAWLARDIYGSNIELTFAVEPEFSVTDAIDDIPVISLDDRISRKFSHYVIAVGDGAQRKRLSTLCNKLGMQPLTLVHPSVIRSSRVEIDDGSIVCAGSILTTNVKIGRHVHVNIACTLSHDVTVDDFSTLSPSVHISGNVRTGSGVFLGAGANVINGKAGLPLVIGCDAVVAAGACVTRNVQPDTLVAGVPAVLKRSRSRDAV
ncbi:MAG: transferase [Xanthomonadales bacterium PRO7]|nr:transferase [Xanthomonadales bacterium PRO7]